MKILMLNKFLHPNGGSETYVFNLGDYLIKKGHQVEYFGMDHPDRIVGNSAESYVNNIDFHNNKVSQLVYPFKIIYSREARIKLRNVLEKFNPHIVHINNFNFQLTPSIFYEIKKYNKIHHSRTKIIFTAHDYQLVCPNHMMRNSKTGLNCEKCSSNFMHCTLGKCIHGSLMKSLLGTIEGTLYKRLKTYKYIDKVICPSFFMEKKISKNIDLKNKTITLRNFINEISWEKVDKDNYALYFGRYSKEKGIQTLINVCKRNPDINFIFAGSGPLEDQLSNISNIKNIGFVSGDILKSYIQKAKFSIYPSEWYENCPFSIMESQMYGTPVVGANIGGIPELVKDNNNGLLFESKNEIALENCIIRLWNDDKLLQKLTLNCQKSNYPNLQKYYEELYKIYQTI